MNRPKLDSVTGEVFYKGKWFDSWEDYEDYRDDERDDELSYKEEK